MINLPDQPQNLHLVQNERGYTYISLLDALIFLKDAWKLIVITGFLGLCASGIYLLITPNQYEAIANINMGRVLTSGASIEEPTQLIARMSLPASLDAATIEACGLRDIINIQTQLTRRIELSTPKGVANIVQLKVTRPTPELASACVYSVYEVIRNSQAQMINHLAQVSQAEGSARLVKVNTRLAEDRAILAKANQLQAALNPAYFSILTEIRAFEDEREKLMKNVDINSLKTANLQSPIYIAEKPVFPRKAISLAVGLVGGLFLGVLIALVCKRIAQQKNYASHDLSSQGTEQYK